MRWLLHKLIDAYAVTLGPHLGGRCRFEPSCSHYAKDAITVYGAGKGAWLAVKRIVRCGPWTKGGYDPVPDKLQIPNSKSRTPVGPPLTPP